IEDGVKVHLGASCPCGDAAEPAAAHGQVRANVCYRYHRWRRKERGRCGSGWRDCESRGGLPQPPEPPAVFQTPRKAPRPKSFGFCRRLWRVWRRLCPNGVAQFLAVCSSSILAETPGYVASFSSPLRGKRRVFERHKRLLTDQLQPSTNSDILSELSLPS